LVSSIVKEFEEKEFCLFSNQTIEKEERCKNFFLEALHSI
jgi:hypothetical protein